MSRAVRGAGEEVEVSANLEFAARRPSPGLDAGPGTAHRRAGGRALLWDSANTSALLTARALCRNGWTVDWVGGAVSPWRDSQYFNGGRTVVSGPGDPQLLQLFATHPLDALFLHGDDHVRWMLENWQLVPRVHRHLAPADSLRTALSKEATAGLAARLAVPVLPTEVCHSREAVAEAGLRLAPRAPLVIKGEGGAAGTTLAALRGGEPPHPDVWSRVTRFAPHVMVQRRIDGPRVFLSVVYDHGVELAACAHEKAATFPHQFGPTAFGVTRHVPEVQTYARRMFEALHWHGPANIEFRQDRGDGTWYFMEINPRMGASMGIQDAAGLDLAGTWAAASTGGTPQPPHDTYQDGVHFAWAVRGLALAMRRPWHMPGWGLGCLLGPNSDLAALDAPLRRRALRLALWTARHV